MYNNYLIELGSGNNTVRIDPNDIKFDSYQVTWNSQDYTAWRNATGLLMRNARESRPPKVEFYTRNMMTNTELAIFMNKIRSAFSSKVEKKAPATIYIPEIDGYVTDDVYLADCTPSIYRIDGSTIYYNSFRVAFIGYGTAGSYKE